MTRLAGGQIPVVGMDNLYPESPKLFLFAFKARRSEGRCRAPCNTPGTANKSFANPRGRYGGPGIKDKGAGKGCCQTVTEYDLS
ncbi:MAG: hypothetical protein OHK0011_10500 [Turneriella sp.]